MRIQEIIQRLDDLDKKPRKTREGQWEALCPAHDDTKPSLGISTGNDGRVLINCMAGCDVDSICHKLDIEKKDLFQDSPSVHDQQVWTYTDELGRPVGRVKRTNRPDGSKTIRPYKLDGTAGAMPAPRPLLRLPKLKHASTVFVCEGEKTADACEKLGLAPATTSAQGSKSAKQTDWSPMRGKTVVIFPDNDKAGLSYASQVEELCLKAGAARVLKLELKLLQPDGEHKPGDDLADLRQTEGLQERVEELLGQAQAPAHNLVMRCMADVEPKELEWLWPARFPMGKLAMISGDPGIGKSLTTIDMVARVTAGLPWPDLPDVINPVRKAIIMNMEDDAGDTIRPRLDAAGADVSRVHVLDGLKTPTGGVEPFSLSRHLDDLDKAIVQTGAELVTIDPLSGYLGASDSHKDQSVREILGPVSVLAARHKVAIVVVAHLNKGSGTNAMYRTMGSIGTVAVARSQWTVVKDKTDPTLRLFIEGKNNLGENSSGLAYRVEGTENNSARVVWEKEPVNMSVEEALSVERLPDPDVERRREWLRSKIQFHSVAAQEIYRLGKVEEWSERSLQRTLKDIGGRSFRHDGRHLWTLAEKGDGKRRVQVDTQPDTL